MQLHDDDIAERSGLPDAAHRASQLSAFVDAYGLVKSRRDHFVDQMAEFAIHAARQEAVDASVSPDTTTAVAANGFPILWAVAWRPERVLDIAQPATSHKCAHEMRAGPNDSRSPHGEARLWRASSPCWRSHSIGS